MASTTAWILAGLRPLTATLAPLAANSRQVAAPMPTRAAGDHHDLAGQVGVDGTPRWGLHRSAPVRREAVGWTVVRPSIASQRLQVIAASTHFHPRQPPCAAAGYLQPE
jgi:hypothetical protein